MRNDVLDAKTLRDAAWILRTRARRKTFTVQVLCRVLERLADGMDGGTPR